MRIKTNINYYRGLVVDLIKSTPSKHSHSISNHPYSVSVIALLEYTCTLTSTVVHLPFIAHLKPHNKKGSLSQSLDCSVTKKNTFSSVAAM